MDSLHYIFIFIRLIRLIQIQSIELNSLIHSPHPIQLMAPPRRLSSPSALKVKLDKILENFLGSRNKRFSYRLAQYFACAKLYTFPMHSLIGVLI